MLLLSESESVERAGDGRAKMGLSLIRELMGTSKPSKWRRRRKRLEESWGQGGREENEEGEMTRSAEGRDSDLFKRKRTYKMPLCRIRA